MRGSKFEQIQSANAHIAKIDFSNYKDRIKAARSSIPAENSQFIINLKRKKA